MISVVDILTKELTSIKDDIAENIIDQKRSATGKTVRSLKVEVKEEGNIIKGTISGRADILDLEQGVDANKFKKSNSSFIEIREWVVAKGINVAATVPIWRALNERGWNTTLPNRTNPNGGTKGIISDPINKGLESIEKKVSDFFIGSALNDIKL